jgi:hypothetical protein
VRTDCEEGEASARTRVSSPSQRPFSPLLILQSYSYSNSSSYSVFPLRREEAPGWFYRFEFPQL